MIKKTENKTRLHLEIIRQMITLATSGFGFVAALAWNSVIQDVVNSYIRPYLPAGSGLISLLIYALIVTCLAVLVTYQLSKLEEKIRDE